MLDPVVEYLHMTDRLSPRREAVQNLGRKNLRDQSHSLVNGKGPLSALCGNDTGAFLAAMLQGKEAVIDDARGVRMVENSEDAAFVSRFEFLTQG